MKYITLFIDFEGKWGMPYRYKYDLAKTTENILTLLKKYNIKATFNISGIIGEKYPLVVKDIHAGGHEISVHGHSHKDWLKNPINELDKSLSTTESTVMKLTGRKPTGFRAPYLLNPLFHDRSIYRIMEKRGYLWASNREIRYVNEIIRPDRLRTNLLAKTYAKLAGLGFIRELTKIAINFKLILKEDINNEVIYKGGKIKIEKNRGSRIVRNLKWLFSKRNPFMRNHIMEIPILSPLDCDLLELPDPNSDTSEDLINYSFDTIVDEYKNSGVFFNLNLHDWIIGTSNRILLFEKILEFLSKGSDNKFITPSELLNMAKFK